MRLSKRRSRKGTHARTGCLRQVCGDTLERFKVAAISTDSRLEPFADLRATEPNTLEMPEKLTKDHTLVT